MSIPKACAVLALCVGLTAPAASGQSLAELLGEVTDDHLDPVAELVTRLEAGELSLAYDSAQGYLVSLLQALEIPVSSQGLVFSRTSLQTDRISPWSPRAIYFNDDVYVGFVQESPILEIASIDPDDGAVFYTLIQEERHPPTFIEESTTCLMCHESAVTGGVPGVMVRSVLPDRFGYMVTEVHEGATSDRTPMERRLGGWYVTGPLAGAPHAGNAMAPELSHEITDAQRYLREFDMTSEGKVDDPSERFDASPYLSPHSDLVALLVLAHQTRVHNLITMTQRAARQALFEQDAVLRSTGQVLAEGELLPSARVRIEGSVDRLVREMLFSRAAPLGGPIVGSGGFAAEFAARGPFDAQGRSLRDLDLGERLFRYPLSFLVYSDAFEALPESVRALFYQRLRAILDGEDRDEAFDHLSEADRRAVREILEATKPDFAGPPGA